MTSPAVRSAVMDMFDAPRIDKFGTVLEPKEEPKSSLKRGSGMKRLQTLFSGLTDFDEIAKTDILTFIEDEELKKELSEVLNDPTQMKELSSLISIHSENVKHIIHGYAKLGPVLKIEREMRQVSQKITDLKMKYYIASKSFEQADSRDARKVLARDLQLTELNIQKEKLLQTKEIVAGYELRKIRNYADQINANKLVQTPSVLEMKNKIRNKIMSGQPVLLSGPVGTGKTKIAQEIYQEILEAKHKSGQIQAEDYTKLRSTRIYNGNEESTKRDLDSRPTQLSNKTDSEQAFTYEEGDITTCLRHGLPLIIDEANRTPPNFLSALKKYFALRPGDSYRDPITGEMFAVQSPLQVIFTANEGSKYAKDVSKFQDQIKREVERIYIPYLPDDELYDIFKAKLYTHPGLAQVSTHDLMVTLPALINTAHTINDLYLKGTESDVTASSGKKLKLTSAVLDTKRLLQRVDKSLLGGKNNFRSLLNTSLVEFISQQDIDDDRLILCNLFHAQGLLCKENIPALLGGVTSLKTSDLTAILISSRDQVDKSTGESLLDPRELATGYPESAKGRSSHRLHTFDTLDRDDDGTIIKGIMKSIVEADIFNFLEDKTITSLITKLQNNPAQRGDDDLKTIAQALADRDLSGLGGAELVKHKEKINPLFESLIALDENISPMIVGFNQKITQAQESLSQEEKKKAEEATANGVITHDAINTPQAVLDYRAGRETGIKEIEATKLTEIKACADKMIADGTFVFENRAGLGSFATFKNLPNMPKNIKGEDTFGFYDPSSHIVAEEAITKTNDYKASCAWTTCTREEVYLKAMRGSQPDDRSDSQIKTFAQKAKTSHQVGLCSKEKMEKLLTSLGAEFTKQYPGKSIGEQEQIALWMYLTGYYGSYWLENYDMSSEKRGYLGCHDDYRWFDQNDNGHSNAGFLLAD